MAGAYFRLGEQNWLIKPRAFWQQDTAFPYCSAQCTRLLLLQSKSLFIPSTTLEAAVYGIESREGETGGAVE